MIAGQLIAMNAVADSAAQARREAYPNGYGRFPGEYGVENTKSLIEGLVEQGFAVYAFDLIGFGLRIQEGTHFYRRYPHWSKLGKMVADTRGAVEMLAQQEGIDPARIFAGGYALGATVGLYAAALDDQIAGVVSVAGFTPMRLDTPDKGTEGIRAFSHLHGLLPRLGFFVGEERRIPFDFHEIMACIAPRPLLVMAPQRDRDATFADVQQSVREAQKIYGLYAAEGALQLEAPNDYNRYSAAMIDATLAWIRDKK